MYIFYHIKTLFPFFETIIQKQHDLSTRYIQKNGFYFYNKEPVFKLIMISF